MSDEKKIENEGVSIFDSFHDFFKERIQKPFPLCFIFCWLTINYKFALNFYFSDKDTLKTLTEWDFSDFIFGVHVAGANSFIYPFFYAVILTFALRPFNLFVAGLLYSVSGKAQRFAINSKLYFDSIKPAREISGEIIDLKNEKEELKNKISFLMNDLSTARIKKEGIEAEIENLNEKQNEVNNRFMSISNNLRTLNVTKLLLAGIAFDNIKDIPQSITRPKEIRKIIVKYTLNEKDYVHTLYEFYWILMALNEDFGVDFCYERTMNPSNIKIDTEYHFGSTTFKINSMVEQAF